jgi:pimeloyl-ACP methyl ester carboxylesterase
MRPRTVALCLVIIVAAIAASATYVRSYTRAAAVFVHMAQLAGPVADALEWERVPVTVEMVTVPSRHGPLRSRLFVPSRIRRAVTLVAGVNMLGIDEPRLYGLAYEVASVGIAVLTPETPDLARFAITPRTTDMIEDSALWLSGQPRLARNGRIGMMGISFSGALSTVAAGRPRLRDRVDYVFSFGGYASFPRVLRFLCTGKEAALDPAGPSGAPAEVYRRPHDYGVAIILLDTAERIVPADQAETLRAAILKFLAAATYDLIDRRLAARTFEEATAMAEAMPEPARTLMRQVNERDVEQLGALLEPVIRSEGQDPALSPEKSTAPACPVFLLHGTDDAVIPAIESLRLAHYLQGKTRVRTLLSSVITHAEMDQQHGYGEIWRLVDFFAALIRA